MGHEGHNKTNVASALHAALAILSTLLFLLAFAAQAFAGSPFHVRAKSQDITGLNHACGTAVDSEGDLYASSAGESKIKVYGPANHTTPIAEIPDSHEPCGLAVDSKGRLYVSEKATGNVARFKPNAYPLNATPVYGSAEPFDSSGEAKGISVDPSDDRLYVTEGNRVTAYEPDGTTGQDEVQKIVIWKTVTGGTFTLKFEGQETAPISVNPSEAKPTDAEIATALEALPAIGVGNVEVEEGPSGVRSHLIVFTHALGGRDVSLLQVDSSGLSGGAVESEGMINGFPSNGHIGEGELSGASGVAAYTYSPGALSSEKRYLFVTDSNKVKVISGKAITNLHVTREIDGKAVPDSGDCPTCSEGFGPLGAGLAADWASGHFFVYDSAHAVVDEFEASGEYLDQVHSPSLSDAEPSGLAALPQHSEAQELHVSGTTTGGSFTLGFGGETSASLAFKATPAQVKQGLEALAGIGAGGVAVSGQAALGGQNGEYRILFTGPLSDRNIAKLTVNDAGLTSITGAFVNTVESGYGPGRLYASVGPSAGAKVLAFGSLAEPGRSPLAALSHVLQTAQAVATDSEGDVYAAAGAKIHVYAPNGEELLRTEGPSKVPLIEDAKEVKDVDVDSTGKVYVLDHNTQEVTYYTPSSYPPTATTTYSRHEPAVAKLENLSKGTGELEGIGLDPASDRLFVTDDGETIELGSAGEGSPILKKELGSAINERKDVAVRGPNGYLYIAAHASVYIVDPAKGVPGEVVARIDGTGSPEGRFTTINPAIAVDQANGHVVVFGNVLGAAEEFDQAGSFVARFGKFTILSRPSRLALDSSLASPNRGNLYVAYDDTAPGSTDVTALGPLDYGTPPVEPKEFKLTVANTGTGSGTVTSSPAGIECGEDCSDVYAEGTKVTLEATADPGSTFAGWSGACSGTATCKVTMSEAKSVTAEFSKESGPVFHKLTITVTGNGKVSADSGTISGCTSAGGSSCEGTYVQGAQVTLTETPGVGSLFGGWGTLQCDESTASTCEVTIGAGDEGVAASFLAAQTLKVTTEGPGTITSSPGLISCTPFCEDSFPQGTKVTLTATPAPGSLLIAWKHCDSGGVLGSHCTVTMDKAKTVTAVFASGHALTVKSSGLGKVQSSPAGISCLYGCLSTTAVYNATTKVTLKATPAKHFHFAGFSGDCTGTGPCEVSMGADREVKALFVRNTAYSLTLARTGAGKGIVKSHPAGINCGYTCISATATYDEGEEVALEVSKVALGSTFGGWSGGGCSGTAPTCVVAISEAKEVIAEFK